MLVKELHLLKTALFNQAVVDGEIPLRKGVIRLVDEAIYKKVPLVRARETTRKCNYERYRCVFAKPYYSQFAGVAGGQQYSWGKGSCKRRRMGVGKSVFSV